MPGASFSRRHVLFDLDGTLADSSPAHARAFVDALRDSHPSIAARFDYTPFAGQATRRIFLALGIHKPEELLEVTQRKQRLYREALERGEVVLFPGAKSLVERLHGQGRRLFLVTGASRISALRVLERTGLRDYFEGVTTIDDVTEGKPSPAPFLHTLALHGLNAADCVVIEDAPSGVASAHAAGLEAILINTDLQLPGVLNAGNCDQLAELLLA